MSGRSEEWEPWFAQVGYAERVRNYSQRHWGHTLTRQDYWNHLHKELAQEVQSKYLVYLDTKHWVNLCHVLVHSSKRQSIYEEILTRLQTLKETGVLYCPVSSPIFVELMSQSDTSTRRATAALMDSLSSGVSIRFWSDVVQAEFARHICKTLQIHQIPHASFPIWTKIGYWAGEHTFVDSDSVFPDSNLRGKVYIDLRWNLTCEEYQCMPDWVPTPDEFAVNWAKAAENSRNRQINSKKNFQALMLKTRSDLISALSDTLKPAVELCLFADGIPRQKLSAVMDPLIQGRNPHDLPSVEIVAGLNAASTLNTERKADFNDLQDYFHASLALPHCDAFFTENFMAHQLRNPPLTFDKTYDTVVGSRPEEILEYLVKLS